jgi:hypothetical protein
MPDDSARAVGPNYARFALGLGEAASALALESRRLRPELKVFSAGPPTVEIDLEQLVVEVRLKLDDGRWVLVEQFSVNPERADFGISRIPLLPGASERTH